MTTKLREHVCPNCGAPLGIPDRHERFFKCQFCGTVLEDQATEKEQETGVFKIKISQEQISAAKAERIPVYSAPPVRTAAPPATVQNPSNRLGCIITIAVFLLVGGILGVSLVPALLASGAFSQALEQTGLETIGDASGLDGLRLYSFGPITTLPSDNDTSPDLVGVGRGSDELEHVVYIDFENEPPLRWRTEISGEDASFLYNQFVSDSSRVYYSYGNKAAAFNRVQGTRIWETTLPDEIQHNICPGCFQLIDETIVALTADGTLTALNAADGSVAWQTRLVETPRQIVNFGGNPAVLDDIDDQVGLKVFNLTDGRLIQQALPACPSEPFPDSPQEISIYSYMQSVGDGEGIIFFGGFFEPGCAIRWDPGQENDTWLTTYNSRIASNIDPENIITTPETLFIARGSGAYSINLETGDFTTLIENEDYSFFPIAARDGVLTLRTERTRGTRQWEIWGVDAALGNVKWTFVPEAESYLERPSESLDDEGNWTAGLTSDGLTVAQLYGEPARVVFQTIPLQSGTATAPVTNNISSEDYGTWVTILGWRSNTFWLLESTSVFVIDVTTGETDSVWP